MMMYAVKSDDYAILQLDGKCGAGVEVEKTLFESQNGELKKPAPGGVSELICDEKRRNALGQRSPRPRLL